MSGPSSGVSRRQFLGGSACNAVGLAAGLVGLAASATAGSPSGHVRVGVIGARRQGRKLALELSRLPGAELTIVCDVDEAVLDRCLRDLAENGSTPRREQDFRRVLDDPRLDAVVIATPDHSHAVLTIEAVRAGKDVYVETPVCHTLEEAGSLRNAVRNSGRIVQSGHFERSLTHVRNAIDFVASGRLGAVPLAKAWAVHRRPAAGDAATVALAPAGVDYDAWLYPLAERPFSPQRFHRSWQSFWDYGSGELGTSGVALLDLACWGLKLRSPERVTASGGRIAGGTAETPDTLITTYDFPQATIQWEHRQWSNHPPEGRSVGLAFYGERGTLVLDRGGWKVYDAAESAGEDGRADITAHLNAFLDAVRTRREPVAALDPALDAAVLCHLGNLAYRAARELRVDRTTGEITVPSDVEPFAHARYRPGVRLA